MTKQRLREVKSLAQSQQTVTEMSSEPFSSELFFSKHGWSTDQQEDYRHIVLGLLQDQLNQNLHFSMPLCDLHAHYRSRGSGLPCTVRHSLDYPQLSREKNHIRFSEVPVVVKKAQVACNNWAPTMCQGLSHEKEHTGNNNKLFLSSRHAESGKSESKWGLMTHSEIWLLQYCFPKALWNFSSLLFNKREISKP